MTEISEVEKELTSHGWSKNVKCPWCGYEHGDYHAFYNLSTSMFCQSCGKYFHFESMSLYRTREMTQEQLQRTEWFREHGSIVIKGDPDD